MVVSASIVIYNDDPRVFEKAILSFLESCNGTLIIVDNSDIKTQSSYFKNDRVKYIKNHKNIGFGAGHNLALKEIDFKSDVHFFINPDTSFDNIIDKIALIFEANEDFGALMPNIVYPDGTKQNLCKLLPTPIDLFLRRFLDIKFLKKLFSTNYVLKNLDENQFTEIPTLSGCFLCVRTNILKEINGFDERFFLYMEDIDLVRRVGMKYKTIFCPFINVKHGFKKGSYRNHKLLILHIKSAILYFNKYGWIRDKHRSDKNTYAIKKISNL